MLRVHHDRCSHIRMFENIRYTSAAVFAAVERLRRHHRSALRAIVDRRRFDRHFRMLEDSIVALRKRFVSKRTANLCSLARSLDVEVLLGQIRQTLVVVPVELLALRVDVLQRAGRRHVRVRIAADLPVEFHTWHRRSSGRIIEF